MSSAQTFRRTRLCRPFAFFLLAYSWPIWFAIASTDSFSLLIGVAVASTVFGLAGGIAIAVFDKRCQMFEELGLSHWQMFLGSFALLAAPALFVAWSRFQLLGSWIGAAFLTSLSVVTWSGITSAKFPTELADSQTDSSI